MSTATAVWKSSSRERLKAPRFEGLLGEKPGRSPRHVVVVAFLLAVTGFVASTLVVASRLSDVSSGSRELTTDVMPALISLTSLRERLGEVLRATSNAVDSSTAGPPGLDRHIAEIESQEASYQSHANLARQREAWPRVRSLVDDALTKSKLVRADLADKDLDKARADLDNELRPAGSMATEGLASLATSNAMAAEDVARDIDHTRKKATALLLALDLVCALFAVALAAIAVRAARLLEKRSAELLSFAGRVAHDIRGPLSPVLMGFKLLGDELPVDDPRQAIIRRSTRSVGRITAIVDDLLAFAKAGGRADRSARAGVLAAAHATLEEVSPLAESSRITLRVDGPEEEVFAACPSGVLASLLGNLVNNAIKYMGKSEERTVTVHVSSTKSRVLVDVEDTGPGLPVGAELQVFEPYVRADRSGQPGLGLGLATVKRLAEAYGGRVSARSELGGSTFSFDLPLASAADP